MFKIIPQPTSIKPQNDKKGFSFYDATISDMTAAYELIDFVKMALNKNISICRNGKENIILKTDDCFLFQVKFQEELIHISLQYFQ